MNSDATIKIKETLENLFDIQFDVIGGTSFGDAWFTIRPFNIEQELFEINVRFKNKLRIIIEVNPEKYAAFSIKDMQLASPNQKSNFVEYAKVLETMNASIEFFINDELCNLNSPETWPAEWKKYRFRLSKSPVCGENELFDELEITTRWTKIVVGMFLSLLDVVPLEENNYMEGGVKRIEVNRYERNPINRELCLASNGYRCAICGFDFEEKYGDIGHDYIHVHHIVPVSKAEGTYEINPVTELIPVCPNCHAMLHRKDPPLLPVELQIIINKK